MINKSPNNLKQLLLQPDVIVSKLKIFKIS